MVKDPSYDCYLIQERLFSHRELVRLSGSGYLQTMRMITHVRKNGDIKIKIAFLKPIVGNNFTDNHYHGTTGNLLSRIHLDSGTLQPAIHMGTNVLSATGIDCHPDTGVVFSNFVMPHWDDAQDLVVSAARHFAPIRTIGWDVAVTPNGPFLIEANFSYDPPVFGDIDSLLSEFEL